MAAPRLRLRGAAAHLATALGLTTYPLYLLHQDAGAVLAAGLIAHGLAPVLASGLVAGLMLGAAGACALVAEPWLRARLSAAMAAGRRDRLARDGSGSGKGARAL